MLKILLYLYEDMNLFKNYFLEGENFGKIFGFLQIREKHLEVFGNI